MIARRKPYTTTEAAERLGVSARTVSRMCDRGELPFYRTSPGGDRRIPVSAVDAYLREHHGLVDHDT